MSEVAPVFSHLVALSDGIGLFEHAEYTSPRREHGYCVDDVARGLIVLARHEEVGGRFATPDGRLAQLAEVYLRFVAESQDAHGRIVNRCDVDGVRHGEYGVEDCWGRALWGLGTTAARSRDEQRSSVALRLFDRSARLRSPWPRAMAFAGLGAAQVLRVDPGHATAADLLRDAVSATGRPGSDSAWPWPEARLTYANAVVPDLLMAAGDVLHDDSLIRDGLALLEWLWAVETTGGHLSVTPVAGRGPGDTGPGFDQQPIEVATLADACARACDVTGDRQWHDALLQCAAWFGGVNDVGVVMRDEQSGGCFDGLEEHGRNQNQGAESTLAMISTMLHAQRLEPTPA